MAALPTLTADARAAIVDHAGSCAVCFEIVSELLPANPAMAETISETPERIPPESVAPLAQIDRYQVIRNLGAGAMGVVFAAYDPELARNVAVKVLRRGGSADRMRREAQALAKLAHPNVVAVYDVGDHAGSMFVTMELVDGVNLRSWLATERSTDEVLDAILQAGRGVEAAHAAGIIHRDLKPDNIFVAETGNVLVGDFGLARSGGDTLERSNPATPVDDLTATGTLLGTPAYMAPEQLEGVTSEASDQFALCVTAWEALYGERPFNAPTIEKLALAVQRGVPKTPATPKLPARVRAALRRGLAVDPRERFPSVSALLAELGPRRRRWPYAVAALGVVAIGAGAFAMTRGPSLDAQLAECALREGPSVWDAARRVQLSPEAAVIVDRYADEWKATARTACEATVRNEQAAPAMERCLERRATTLGSFLDTPAAAEIQKLLEYLEPSRNCRDVVASAPPSAELAMFQRDLDRAMVVALTELPVDAQSYVSRADGYGDEATRAEAYFLLAVTRVARGEEAEPALVSTIQHADLARDDRLRTRASAMRAAAAARAGRTADAVTQRDLARSAAARGSDPVAAELVELATMEIARAAGDLQDEIRALRGIEKLLVTRFGEDSVRVAAIRFVIGSKLQVAKDPAGNAIVLASIKKLEHLVPAARATLKGLEEVEPARRLPIDRQLVAVARSQQSPDLPNHLGGLAADCFLVRDYECALQATVEAIELQPEGQAHEDFVDDAAAFALEAALHTADKAKRAKLLDQALAWIERLTPAARERDSAQASRGRALLALGRPKEAIAPLSIAVDAAERAEQKHPWRMLVRSFALAQALWLGGGEADRKRARMLVEQATASVPGARAYFDENPVQYSGSKARLEEVVLELAAWRRTH